MVLTTADSQVQEGSPTNLDLNITGVNCTSLAPSNESVTYLRVVFGDEYVLTYGLGVYRGVNMSDSCRAAPWTLSAQVQYPFHELGSVNVSAEVGWADGYNATSNVLTLNVVSPGSAGGAVVMEWVEGTLSAGAVLLIIAVTLNRLLPRRPLLPA